MSRESDSSEPEGSGLGPEPADRLKEILAQALAIDPEERKNAILRLCSGAPELAEEILSLLQHTGGPAPWLEGPLVSLRPADHPPSLPEGSRIGPYRITAQLGEGGMGAVAKAVREDDFRLQVAIKVIRRGTVSDSSIRRFQEERQILAQLDHPNIARILDGGETSEGHPYFALEYVDGLPINEHLRSHPAALTNRLAMFLKICSALSLAHRNLIIHRDLKPGNILVTLAGEPKLVDFGIAKRLGPAADAPDLTGDDRLPMTLRYASPEQLRGAVMTTRSDVYSLGVILYELLVNEHPFAACTGDTLALVRAIGETVPERPSRVTANPRSPASEISRDLDSIVLKAMSNDPDNRYRSVDDLADDLTRYLDGQPVLAREATWGYRFAKFARRHRAAIFTGALALLLIVGASVVTTILWRQAVEDRSKALAARERTARVLDFTKDLFWSSSESPDAGPEMTAQEILKKAEKGLDSEVADPLLQAELLNTVGEVLVNLDLLDEAQAPLEKAARILFVQFPEGHRDLARAINNRASWFFRSGRYEEAEPLYREALAMKQALPSGEPCEPSLVKSMSNMALILMTRGAYEEAEGHYLRALACRRASEPPDPPVLARSLLSLGVLYHQIGKLTDAETLMREALVIRLASFGPEDPAVATVLSSLGRLLTSKGDHDQAEETLTQALSIRSEQLGREHHHTALAQLDLVQLFIDSGRAGEGRALMETAIKTLREGMAPGTWEVARAESLLGWYLMQDGEYSAAASLLTTAYETLSRVRGPRSVSTRQVERTLRELAGRWPEAELPQMLRLKEETATQESRVAVGETARD